MHARLSGRAGLIPGTGRPAVELLGVRICRNEGVASTYIYEPVSIFTHGLLDLIGDRRRLFCGSGRKSDRRFGAVDGRADRAGGRGQIIQFGAVSACVEQAPALRRGGLRAKPSSSSAALPPAGQVRPSRPPGSPLARCRRERASGAGRVSHSSGTDTCTSQG